MRCDERIIRHLRRIWQFNQLTQHPRPEVRSGDGLLELTVVQVNPLIPDQGVWGYATCGVHQIPTTGNRQEFVLLSPVASPVHPTTLAEVTLRYGTPGGQFTLGDVVELDQPWLSGSQCDRFLVSRPYIIDPLFEYLDLGNLCIQFSWLLPITRQEADFLAVEGLESLESRFEQAQLRPIDATRPSVI